MRWTDAQGAGRRRPFPCLVRGTAGNLVEPAARRLPPVPRSVAYVRNAMVGRLGLTRKLLVRIFAEAGLEDHPG